MLTSTLPSSTSSARSPTSFVNLPAPKQYQGWQRTLQSDWKQWIKGVYILTTVLVQWLSILRHSKVSWGLKGVLERAILRCGLAVTVEGLEVSLSSKGDSPAGGQRFQVTLCEPQGCGGGRKNRFPVNDSASSGPFHMMSASLIYCSVIRGCCELS